ncbi:MAG: tetratricopeptide repeat protein [Chlorobi bacterium]|nr:tetratricopeptide repeat protein [Chlorobiota bacterium]
MLLVIANPAYPNKKEDSTYLQATELVRQAKTTATNSPQQSLIHAKMASRLLERFGQDDTLLPQAYFQTAYAYFMLGRTDSSVMWLNRILSLPDAGIKIKAKSLNLLCIDYRKLGNNQKASQMAQEAIAAYRSVNDSSGIMDAIINNAKVYHISGNNKKAMQLYMNALEYADGINNPVKVGFLYSMIANVYMDIEQPEKGKEYYRKAIQKLKFNKQSNRYADLLNNYGIVFYDEGMYDSALFYYNQAMDIYQQIGQTDAIAVSYQNIGITYVQIQDEKKGLRFLHKAQDIFKKLELPGDQASVNVDLGNAFIETRQYDSASFYLERALEISDNIQNTYYKKQALFALYELYEKSGNDRQALNYYKKYSAFKDSLDNQSMKKNLQELEVRYQTAQRENEIARLKNRELLDKAQKRLLIVGIIGLILVFGFALTVILIRRKKDKVIQHQRILMHRKEEELAKAELARRQAYEKQLERELEYKTKQLATHALNMMQKNKLLQDITNDIEARINSADCKSKEAMTEVKMSIKQGLNVDKDWDLFKMYFEQINKDFFRELKKMNNRLTGNDYKLAALIKLNMSIKEMASVLNISPDSLKNARYRLKKKLNLREEDNLNGVIRDI